MPTSQHKLRPRSKTDETMSSGFSANQYENAFKSQRLQNWCVSKDFKERPTAHEGHTSFIANDRGHLLPGAVKKGSAWPKFKGTWDLPTRIPAHHICPTARSAQGLIRLKSWGFGGDGCEPQRGSKNKDQDAARQQDGAAQSSSLSPTAIKGLPDTLDLPTTEGDQRTSTQDLRAAVDGSVSQTTEGVKPAKAPGEDRPLSQSTAKEKPVSRPASRSDTGKSL